MPKLGTDSFSQTLTVGGTHFQFSGVRPERLGATEYTLATIVVDESSSVQYFADDLLDGLKVCLHACKDSPRADNLLLRVTSFNENLKELHGFKELNTILDSDYNNFHPNGWTALYDATMDGLVPTGKYAEMLVAKKLSCNACVFVITDGMSNRGHVTSARTIYEQILKLRMSETLESIEVVLIGINTENPDVQTWLNRYREEAKLDSYVDIGKATPQLLASMGRFISSSIMRTSTVLQTGKSQQPIGFNP